MSKNSVKISSNFGGSISTHAHLHPKSPGSESGKNLNNIQVIKAKNEELNNNNEPEEKKYQLYHKFLAELFGTTMLLYTNCLGGVFNKDLLYVGILSSSFGVLFLVYCFVHISGAHFNPAVSLPLYLKGALTLKELLTYMAAQVIGAFIGCCFIALSRKGRFEELNATKIQAYLISVNGGDKIDAWCYISSLFTEIFCTFMLNFFIFATSDKKTSMGNVVGLGFGGLLTSLIFIGAKISGSSFNPARSLAPAVLQAISGGDTKPIEQIWIYILGPFTGGVLSYYAWKIFIL